jgi:hypothetical protein
MKKIILASCLAACFISTCFADDANCKDTTTFPTIAKQCTCIMDNAVHDCTEHSPIKSICNDTSLGNYFKEDVPGAEAQCQRYGGMPSKCAWSVTFYDSNC